jgi:hypothetical protein
MILASLGEHCTNPDFFALQKIVELRSRQNHQEAGDRLYSFGLHSSSIKLTAHLGFLSPNFQLL